VAGEREGRGKKGAKGRKKKDGRPPNNFLVTALPKASYSSTGARPFVPHIVAVFNATAVTPSHAERHYITAARLDQTGVKYLNTHTDGIDCRRGRALTPQPPTPLRADVVRWISAN